VTAQAAPLVPPLPHCRQACSRRPAVARPTCSPGHVRFSDRKRVLLRSTARHPSAGQRGGQGPVRHP
jgi:hypothetical protein